MKQKYITQFSKSDEYRKKIHDFIPGGAHTYSKGDDQFPQLSPAVITHGKGSHIWDVDGNEYIECLGGLASISLGHAYEPVVNRVIQELWKGNNFSRPSVIEMEMAEKFLDHLPGHDMIKFAKNGSTITTAAVKLARAYTGRKLVVRAAEHPFFSYDDWFIGSTDVKAGIPDEVSQLTVTFKADDLESLKQVFTQYPNQIACVIAEPEKFNPVTKEYLQQAIDFVHSQGAVWIMDEMITGYRSYFPGSMVKFGVIPDLATWGKGIANGFSFCCLTGKKEIMELGGIRKKEQEKLFLISTTHGGETCSIAAAIATTEEFQKHKVIEHNHALGKKYMNEANKMIEKHHLLHSVQILQFPWHVSLTYLDSDGNHSWKLRTLFHQEMIKRGILFQGIFCPHFSHTDNDLEQILNAFDEACNTYKKALEEGVEKYLVGAPIKPVFRKYI